MLAGYAGYIWVGLPAGGTVAAVTRYNPDGTTTDLTSATTTPDASLAKIDCSGSALSQVGHYAFLVEATASLYLGHGTVEIEPATVTVATNNDKTGYALTGDQAIGALTISGGITVTQSVTNSAGVSVTGNGTGAGILATGGSGGAGVEFVGGAGGAGGKLTGSSADALTLSGGKLRAAGVEITNAVQITEDASAPSWTGGAVEIVSSTSYGFTARGAGGGMYLYGSGNTPGLQVDGAQSTDTNHGAVLFRSVDNSGAGFVCKGDVGLHLRGATNDLKLEHNTSGSWPTSGGASAADVWNYLTSSISTTGSIGKLLKDDIDAPVTSRLAPTTVGRTLDVSAGGEAGVDWANVGSPTTTVGLSGTTIATSQVVASVSGAVSSVTGAVGSVTGNVGGNVSGSVASVSGNVGGNVSGSVGSVTGNVGGNLAGNVLGTLSTTERNAIAAALLDLVDGVETDYTVREAFRLVLAAVAGKSSRSGSTRKYRDVNDTADRISATTDAIGQRTAVTLNP